MSLALCALPGNETFAAKLGEQLGCARVRVEARRFPDGETYLRFLDDPAGRRIAFVCALNNPDAKIQELLFAAQLDRAFDWLVTVDAHLHRRASLAEIFAMRSVDVSAAEAVAGWIGRNVPRPLIVGPDRESWRWAAAVAAPLGAPQVVLSKIRSGDREVRVEAPSLAAWRDRTPVLVDDIISTARTMVAAVRALGVQGFPPPVCVGVHAIFAGDALDVLRASGAGQIVTANTVNHPTNGIDATPAVVRGLRALLPSLKEQP